MISPDDDFTMPLELDVAGAGGVGRMDESATLQDKAGRWLARWLCGSFVFLLCAGAVSAARGSWTRAGGGTGSVLR